MTEKTQRRLVRAKANWGAQLFALLLIIFPTASMGQPGETGHVGRTIVLGFDGMDPKLTEAWMADGTMPNFAKLREQGSYQVLPTTNPAQSPVAWSSFATGLNPGAHGIFDFLSRNPQTYGPDYSIASVKAPEMVLKFFGYQLPLDSGSITNKRVGTPFWTSAEREGQPSSVISVPVTYPPDQITRMLAGMGVPDLLGTQGTFTLYTTDTVDAETTGGRQIHVEAANGRVEAAFEGPPDPFVIEPTPLTVPIAIEQRDGSRAHVTLDGTEVDLAVAGWSDFVPLKFTFGGFMNVRGLVRLQLVEGFPNLKLYVSPIQIDPRAPVVPITSPPEYAADLASRIGLFHTIGMPEETWALNEGQMTDDGWLDMEATILQEREKMFFDTLAQNDSKLIVQVFVQTDRTSHMFWRGIDEQHPLHNQTSERGKGGGPLDLRRGRSHPGQDDGRDAAGRSADRAQRPRLRALALGHQPQSLAGRQRLHGHETGAAELRAAVRQRQLAEDPGLRHRPQRNLSQPAWPRGPGRRPRGRDQAGQAGDHRQARRCQGSGDRRAVHADRVRCRRDLCRQDDGRRARPRGGLCARLPRLVADGPRRGTGAAGCPQ